MTLIRPGASEWHSRLASLLSPGGMWGSLRMQTKADCMRWPGTNPDKSPGTALNSPWLVCLLCADLSLEVMMRCTAGLLGTATNDRDHCALYSRQVQVQSRFYDNILWIFYGRLRTCKVSLLNIKYWVDNLNFAQISELANYSPADYRSQVVMTNTKYNWLPEKIISGSKY